MLEKEEQVVALVKDVMREFGLKRNGRIEFNHLLPDLVGRQEPNQPHAVLQAAPHWNINLHYPTDGEESSTTYSFQVNTSEFQNEEQIKSFIIDELKKQM